MAWFIFSRPFEVQEAPNRRKRYKAGKPYNIRKDRAEQAKAEGAGDYTKGEAGDGGESERESVGAGSPETQDAEDPA